MHCCLHTVVMSITQWPAHLSCSICGPPCTLTPLMTGASGCSVRPKVANASLETVTGPPATMLPPSHTRSANLGSAGLLMSYMHRSPAAAAAQTSSAFNCKLVIPTFSAAEYNLYCRMILHLGPAGGEEGCVQGSITGGRGSSAEAHKSLVENHQDGRWAATQPTADVMMTSAVSAPCGSPLLAHVLVGRSTPHRVTPCQQPLLHNSDLHVCA